MVQFKAQDEAIRIELLDLHRQISAKLWRTRKRRNMLNATEAEITAVEQRAWRILKVRPARAS